MAWLKLHDDILGDPKLMRAARVGGAELVLLPWLLAFASKAADKGRLSVGAAPAEPEDIAYQIPGVTAAQVEAAQRALVAIGVLIADETDGCLCFAKWDGRQAKPSSSKTAIRERVAKHRSKGKKGNAGTALQGVTKDETGGDTGHVTPCNATEKRRGEEKRREKKNSLPPAADDTADVTPPMSGLDALPKAVCDAAYERWTKLLGAIPYSRFRLAILPIYKAKEAEHPTQDGLLNAIQAFRDGRDAERPPYRAKYTINYFAESLTQWTTLGAMPYVDEWGEPTERGRMAGFAA